MSLRIEIPQEEIVRFCLRYGIQFFLMEQELSGLFGRKVDLNTPRFRSRHFREEVQLQAEVLYDAT